jgi:hypothetical protein
MQLAHFGAFYKRSWRANDWTFGRLDGIDRAVRIALNPDSLQRRYGARLVSAQGPGSAVTASDFVYSYLKRLAVSDAEPELIASLDAAWSRDDQAIRTELAWLDLEATVPPPVLEYCARALTRRLQLEALRVELPEIAASLRMEKERGAPPSTAGIALLERLPHGSVPDMAVVADLMKGNLLGSDTMQDQVGTDLFTRTASHGLSTAHAALSKNGGLDAISIVLKLTDWPLRVLYLLTNRLMRGGRTSATIHGLLLGTGLALVAAGAMADKLPALALTLGWSLLAGVLAHALLGARRPKRLVVALFGAVVVVSLVLVMAGVLSLPPLALILACIALGMMVLQPWLASVSTSAVILAIAVSTVHGSADDWLGRLTLGSAANVSSLSGVTAEQCAEGAKPVAPHDADSLKKACGRREVAERMQMVQWPVLTLVAVLLLAALQRAVGRLALRVDWRWPWQ